jgi:hypothetical protein
MTSSSNYWPFFNNTILHDLHDELSNALSELQLRPEHLRRGDLQPKFVVDLLQDSKAMLPQLSPVQWAALKSVVYKVAGEEAGVCASPTAVANCRVGVHRCEFMHVCLRYQPSCCTCRDGHSLNSGRHGGCDEARV